jgi:hypothetical protein
VARRRRSGAARLLRALLVVAVLAALAVGADRLAVRLVDGEAESRLAQSGLEAPAVAIRGFPFLTQAARNDLDHVDIAAAAYVSGGDRLTDVRGKLTGVSYSAGGVRAATADLTAVVPFAAVERRLPDGDLRLTAAGSEVRVIRTFEALGQTFGATATASVRLDGDRLRVEPTRVTVPGSGPVDDVVTDIARDRVRFDVPVTGLPPGFRLEAVEVVQSGFRVRLTGRDVLLDEGASAR